LERVIARLKISVPILSYAKTDQHLKSLLISQLLKNCLDTQEEVIVPDGLKLVKVDNEEFDKYRGILGGITPRNAA
jgi:hypothetical protein